MGNYNHDEPEVLYKRSRSQNRMLIFGFALIAVAFVSTVFAQSININNGSRVEFGQGYYRIVACDSWIGIQLNPSAATYSGTSINGVAYSGESRVKSIQITGLDTKRCAGKNLKFTLTNTETTTALPIFTDTGNLVVSRVLVSVNSNTSTLASNALTIINGNGLNIGKYDAYEYLSYNSNTSVYTLVFTYPLARMADVTGVNFESSLAG